MRKRRMRRIGEEIERRRGWNEYFKSKGLKQPYRVPRQMFIEIFWPSTVDSPACREVIDINSHAGRMRFNSFHIN